MKENMPVVNEDKEHILERIEWFALDLDGTIYLGDQWINGALRFLNKVEGSGRKYVFLTNNSSKNPDSYVEKLKQMGLEISKDSIVTSGQATIFYGLLR
jgi:HAD superfamily hydrolase (TIGR01450 family)